MQSNPYHDTEAKSSEKIAFEIDPGALLLLVVDASVLAIMTFLYGLIFFQIFWSGGTRDTQLVLNYVSRYSAFMAGITLFAALVRHVSVYLLARLLKMPMPFIAPLGGSMRIQGLLTIPFIIFFAFVFFATTNGSGTQIAGIGGGMQGLNSTIRSLFEFLRGVPFYAGAVGYLTLARSMGFPRAFMWTILAIIAQYIGVFVVYFLLYGTPPPPSPFP